MFYIYSTSLFRVPIFEMSYVATALDTISSDGEDYIASYATKVTEQKFIKVLDI